MYLEVGHIRKLSNTLGGYSLLSRFYAGGVLDPYLGIGEPLRVSNPDPV